MERPPSNRSDDIRRHPAVIDLVTAAPVPLSSAAHSPSTSPVAASPPAHHHGVHPSVPRNTQAGRGTTRGNRLASACVRGTAAGAGATRPRQHPAPAQRENRDTAAWPHRGKATFAHVHRLEVLGHLETVGNLYLFRPQAGEMHLHRRHLHRVRVIQDWDEAVQAMLAP